MVESKDLDDAGEQARPARVAITWSFIIPARVGFLGGCHDAFASFPPAAAAASLQGSFVQSWRGGGAANGIVSGATAPPEMMKAMAWSTVQSVGVIFSTGTISR